MHGPLNVKCVLIYLAQPFITVKTFLTIIAQWLLYVPPYVTLNLTHAPYTVHLYVFLRYYRIYYFPVQH